MAKLMTLCVIHKSEKVLLGMKKRGFGAGRWNGFGGKVMPGESIEEAARRELFEEASIEAHDLVRTGIIEFEFSGDPVLLEVHVFRATELIGIPTESEEMRPEWFSVDSLPFARMWQDDPLWFPFLLANKKFKGRVLFDQDDKMLEHDFYEVEELG